MEKRKKTGAELRERSQPYAEEPESADGAIRSEDREKKAENHRTSRADSTDGRRRRERPD